MAIPPGRFRKRLMGWYREHARELPWRGIHDPYATWLSEIMLQQTRVATVIDRYGEFLRQFPTLQALAAAPEDAVLALWSGLGYYRRARMLHRGAQFVVRELEGRLPGTAAELRSLPGVGEYTSAAIGSIAFGESIAVVDGNVERVLLRILGLAEDRSAAGRARIHSAAQSLVPAAARRRPGLGSGLGPGLDPGIGASALQRPAQAGPNPPGDHNQAMMELGATICLPREPLCLQCPVVSLCRTRGEHRTEPRGRQQSRLVAHLLAIRKCGAATEVLLERRPAGASLMPGMLELPPLPVAAVEGREPVLRLRHGITDTNYLVEVYSEGARGSLPLQEVGEWEEPASAASPDSRGSAASAQHSFGADVFPCAQPEAAPAGSDDSPSFPVPLLLAEVPAAAADLEWTPVTRLRSLPLTGLARKCLQRLRVMPADVRHSR